MALLVVDPRVMKLGEETHALSMLLMAAVNACKAENEQNISKWTYKTSRLRLMRSYGLHSAS